MKNVTPLVLGLLLAFGVSGGATAQGSYGQGQPPSSAQQGTPPAGAPAGAAAAASDFSDDDVETFVEVQPDIEEIRAEYSERLQGVEDPTQAAQLQQEAGQRMVETVTEAGLEVETYNNIAIALQSDAELRQRVESMMN